MEFDFDCMTEAQATLLAEMANDGLNDPDFGEE